MGYLHINNLYKEQAILMFRECYALEKIHGTSAHVSLKLNPSNPTQRQLVFFSGGEKHERFVALFDQEKLLAAFNDLGIPDDRMPITIYGEAYGGSQQGMSGTYGNSLKFIAFDVQIGEYWLDVPNAEQVCQKLGIEFVHYVKISTDLKEIDAQRDAPSVQAIRNGISVQAVSSDGTIGTVENPKKREGVVLRPLVEVRLNNGDRVIAKHKGDDFKETTKERRVLSPEDEAKRQAQMKAVADAQSTANEWVTLMRLNHVLDKIPGHNMDQMGSIIKAMMEDVFREGTGELNETDQTRKAIGKRTVELYKQLLREGLEKKTAQYV